MTTQSSLLDQAYGEHAVRFQPNFAGWQAAARVALHRRLAPGKLWWEEDGAATPPAPPAESSAKVPQRFMQLARSAACHRNADRWALLYSLLWRLTQGEPTLLDRPNDPQIAKARRYSQAVHRDIHKMKAFVRFSVERDDRGERYVAWFEPSHHSVRAVAEFFRKRYTAMRWSVLTPDECAHWEGAGKVWFSEGLAQQTIPDTDGFVAAWQLYYRSIFNPARVKERAMQSEMPQKYWRHLPEAELIPSLLFEAEPRNAKMQQIQKAHDELRCGPTPETPEALRLKAAGADQYQQLRAAADVCRACPLWQDATQTVFGEGPLDAQMMLVGEQPGDQEDLLGRAFQGPAGEVLDRALRRAGLPRENLYITNAVKHFKHRVKGKRRLHDKPDQHEVSVCRDWLEQEIALVQPKLIVCMGTTAALAVTGQSQKLSERRGHLLEMGGRHILITYHPAHALRAGAAGSAVTDVIASDLANAKHFLHAS